MMKINFSGLEPTAPLQGEPSELFDGISNSPSFAIPNTTNVSLTIFLPCSFIFVNWGSVES